LQPACLTVSVHPHGSRNAPVGRTTPDWGVVFEASVWGWEGAMGMITQNHNGSQYRYGFVLKKYFENELHLP